MPNHAAQTTVIVGQIPQGVDRRDRDDRATQSVIGGLSERYRRVLAGQDRTTYIHLGEARVFTAGVSPQPPGGMHWRGRLSKVSGWSFGHLGEPSPASVEDPNT